MIAFALVVATGLTLQSASQAGADTVPYSDPNAHGVIGLCDRNGNSIDHGKITDRPFVWAAISSEAAPAEYAIDGKTATLFAFQPREAHEPAEFSGQMLTASSRYDNAAHPKAQATDGDYTLKEFTDTFPAKLDGLVQLRMYLGAPGEPTLGASYAATDIQVTGDTWKVVRGESVPCNASTAISIEEIYGTAPTTVPPAAETAEPATSADDDAAASASTVPTDDDAPSSSTESEESADAASPVASDAVSESTESDGTSILPAALAALFAAVFGALLWAWRRRYIGKPAELGADKDNLDPTQADPGAPSDGSTPETNATDEENQRVTADSTN
jgi:hypothetical protein